MRAPSRVPPADHRLSDPHHKISDELDDRLVHVLQQASCFMPEGWRLEVTSGFRSGSRFAGTGGISQHASGLAIDVQLINPQGRYIPNKSSDQSGQIWEAYRQLADIVFHVQRVLYPELDGRLAWGGKFTLASGEWDVMHFDLGGFRGRGRYQPPGKDDIPETILAGIEPGPGGDDPAAA
jgi:hypothetical protein